jgi:hypothetical protein
MHREKATAIMAPKLLGNNGTRFARISTQWALPFDIQYEAWMSAKSKARLKYLPNEIAPCCPDSMREFVENEAPDVAPPTRTWRSAWYCWTVASVTHWVKAWVHSQTCISPLLTLRSGVQAFRVRTLISVLNKDAMALIGPPYAWFKTHQVKRYFAKRRRDVRHLNRLSCVDVWLAA